MTNQLEFVGGEAQGRRETVCRTGENVLHRVIDGATVCTTDRSAFAESVFRRNPSLSICGLAGPDGGCGVRDKTARIRQGDCREEALFLNPDSPLRQREEHGSLLFLPMGLDRSAPLSSFPTAIYHPT
jgi:hypothetical protein